MPASLACTLTPAPAKTPVLPPPAAALPDIDLLARLLSGGRNTGRARRAAVRLLEVRSLEAWTRLAPDACALEARRLLGEEAAARVVPVACEFARRALGPPPGVTLSRPEDVVPWLAEWRGARREHFVGFYLNARHQLLARTMISVGSLSASIVHPREVFVPAVAGSAAGVIVAHNHPSGDPEPSPEDLAVTRRLREAGDLLGIELLDHLVVAERGYVSLKSRGAI